MQNCFFAVLCTIGIAYCSLSVVPLYAQPPWGDGPPPWMQRGNNSPSGNNPPRNFPNSGNGNRQFSGSNQQFPRDDAARSTRRVMMLKGMDTNGNGTLEPAEIPEYRRDFVNRIVTELGGNPQGTINLNDLERRAAAQSSPVTPPSAPSGAAVPAAVTGNTLVPPFGEKSETPSSVLTFGQSESKPAIPAAQPNNAPVSASDQILRNAKDILTRFDKNRNGTLDKDKSEWSSTLPFKAEGADKNLDGRISLTEIIAALGGTTTASSGSAATATKPSEAYDHLPQGVPPWFFERDKDKDAQLTMLEYANRQVWTQGLVNEFRFLDTNNDGFATIAEVFAVLKQTDEQKALAEDKAKREAAKTGGKSLNETPAGNPPPQPVQQPPAQPASAGSAGQTPPPNAPYAAGNNTNTAPNAAAEQRSPTNRSSRRTR